MVEALTEVVAGLVVLACAVLWIPHEISIRKLRADVDEAQEDIKELKRKDAKRDGLA